VVLMVKEEQSIRSHRLEFAAVSTTECGSFLD
jgi:hypothetical protein